VNRTFSPTQEEVKRAKRILEAVATQGSGAIVVDGRMVDSPLVVAAQHVVDIANLLGMDE
jgi:citrate lyase subunit beta/citryl-CoA lyase